MHLLFSIKIIPLGLCGQMYQPKPIRETKQAAVNEQRHHATT